MATDGPKDLSPLPVYAEIWRLVRLVSPNPASICITYCCTQGCEGSIPVPDAAPVKNPELNETQRAILETLRASDTPMTRKDVATKMGRKRTGGRFAQCFPYLLELGYIHLRDGEYTDDASKFGDDD